MFLVVLMFKYKNAFKCKSENRSNPQIDEKKRIKKTFYIYIFNIMCCYVVNTTHSVTSNGIYDYS